MVPATLDLSWALCTSCSMVDQNGREFTAKQLSGRWVLLDTCRCHALHAKPRQVSLT